MKKWMSVLLAMACLFVFAFSVIAEPATTEPVTETVTDTEEDTQTETDPEPEPEPTYTELNITVTVTQHEDGTIEVYLMDNQPAPVSFWPVILEVDGEEVARAETDYSGMAIIDYTIPSDATTAVVYAYSGAYDIYYFNGGSAQLEIPTDTAEPTTEPPTETTTEPTEPPTTTAEPSEEATTTTTLPREEADAGLLTTTTTESVSTTTLMISPLTTTVKGDIVWIGVDVDEGVLTASQLSRSTFFSKARMQMSKALYEMLVSTSSSTIHLEMTLNETAGARDILLAAKNADKAYSSYDDSTVVGFAVNTGLAYVDGENRVPLEVADDVYTIEFPVPENMKRSETIAVAVCTADGLSTLNEIVPDNGVLTFTVQRFQTFAIVGFGTETEAVADITTPWYLIAMIVGGVVLILGGVALLVFVGIRRKKVAGAACVSEETDADMKVIPDAPTKGTPFTLDADGDEATVETKSAKPPVTEETKTPEPSGTSPTAQVGEERARRMSGADAGQPLSADDLLDEVLNDLDQLDTE